MPAYIDLPNGEISGPAFHIAGWIAADARDAAIAVRVNGKLVGFDLRDRPDLQSAPGLCNFAFTSGVYADVKLDEVPPDGMVSVELFCNDEKIAKLVRMIGVTESPAGAVVRAQSRCWCEAHLRCPACAGAAATLVHEPGRIVCGACRTAYPQDAGALNFISSELGLRAKIEPTENVSSNPYTPDALRLIETTVANGGWVLDCGAGSRPERMAQVINVEIVDYPSTDVLAVGEALPFADGSFDAVLTLAVLEHVRDPFACAREIMRVLKPGGEVLADVPFLQPVHGYPHHYYNMTPQGLINLFAGLGEVIECRVPPHGHPIFAVQWIINQYLCGLPDDIRASFASMTIGEVASVIPHKFLTTPAAYMLETDMQNVIGCLNSLRFRKT